MAIRRRLATSDPVAFNHDKAIRVAFRHGLTVLHRERREQDEFPEDKTSMDLDRAIAFLERQLKHDGPLSIATE